MVLLSGPGSAASWSAEVGEQDGGAGGGRRGAVEVEVGSLQRPRGVVLGEPAGERRRRARRGRRRGRRSTRTSRALRGVEAVGVGVDGRRGASRRRARRRTAGRRRCPARTARPACGAVGWMKPRRRCRAARAPRSSSPVTAAAIASSRRGGLGRVGDADHLAELDRELDRRARARQPLLPRSVSSSASGGAAGRARGRASTRGWRRRGCPEHMPWPANGGIRCAASPARNTRPACHCSAYARLERVDGVAFEARVARVHVPRREQLPRRGSRR